MQNTCRNFGHKPQQERGLQQRQNRQKKCQNEQMVSRARKHGVVAAAFAARARLRNWLIKGMLIKGCVCELCERAN